jgi:hypothetical protein
MALSVHWGEPGQLPEPPYTWYPAKGSTAFRVKANVAMNSNANKATTRMMTTNRNIYY